MFKLTTIAVVLFGTTAINLFACYMSWQRKRTRSGLYFALGMLAVTGWTLSAALDYAAVPIPLKVFFAKLEYTFYNSAFACFALFVFAYAGYESWLRNKAALALGSLLPLSNIVLAWTNDWHGLLWSGFTPSEFGDNTVIFEHGPGYVWAAFSGYLMILLIVVPLWQASRSGSTLSRRQARLLMMALLIPVAGNLIYLLQSPELRGVDWSSLFFSGSGLMFLLALYGARLLDLAPIARDKVIGNLSDGMIVLDVRDRIVDINRAAADLLGAPAATLIGWDVAEATPLARSFLEHSPEQDVRTELEIGAQDKRHFDVLLSPLREGPDSIIGRLLVFRDITERKQLESEREAWAGVLQATFDSATAGILVLDTHGQTVLANNQAAKIWPLGEMQPVEESDYPFLTAIEPFVKNHPDVVEFVDALRNLPENEGVIRLLLTDDRIFDVHVSPYRTGTQIAGQVWTFENVTKRIGAERAEILADERRRISQEAHDGLLQGLVGLRFELNQWHRLLDRDSPAVHGKIDELNSFLTESIDEMRRFIFALRPASLEPGFPAAVRQLAVGMQRYYGLAVEVEIAGPEVRLHQAWQQPLFRVIQESLSNTGKHAHARQAWVHVDLENEAELVLTVRDDGRGFDPARPRSHAGGFGLTHMAERIKSLGGALTVESRPGEGTVVRASIPYNSG